MGVIQFHVLRTVGTFHPPLFLLESVFHAYRTPPPSVHSLLGFPKFVLDRSTSPDNHQVQGRWLSEARERLYSHFELWTSPMCREVLRAPRECEGLKASSYGNDKKRKIDRVEGFEWRCQRTTGFKEVMTGGAEATSNERVRLKQQAWWGWKGRGKKDRIFGIKVVQEKNGPCWYFIGQFDQRQERLVDVGVETIGLVWLIGLRKCML